MLDKLETGRFSDVYNFGPGDEMWVYHYDLETKMKSCVCVCSRDEPPTEIRTNRWIENGCNFLREDRLSHNCDFGARLTVNAECKTMSAQSLSIH